MLIRVDKVPVWCRLARKQKIADSQVSDWDHEVKSRGFPVLAFRIETAVIQGQCSQPPEKSPLCVCLYYHLLIRVVAVFLYSFVVMVTTTWKE